MLSSLKEVIEEGKKRNIAVGAFNTPNLECLLAVLGAAEKLDVPVIISHAQLHESVAPLDKIGPVMVELAKRSSVKVCVHLDHGEDFAYCKKAISLRNGQKSTRYSDQGTVTDSAGRESLAGFAAAIPFLSVVCTTLKNGAAISLVAFLVLIPAAVLCFVLREKLNLLD